MAPFDPLDLVEQVHGVRLAECPEVDGDPEGHSFGFTYSLGDLRVWVGRDKGLFQAAVGQGPDAVHDMHGLGDLLAILGRPLGAVTSLEAIMQRIGAEADPLRKLMIDEPGAIDRFYAVRWARYQRGEPG